MLRSQVNTPVHRVFELLAAGFKDFHRIGVIHLGEIGGDETLKTANGVFIHALGKEFHVIHAFIQHGLKDIFQHAFC